MATYVDIEDTEVAPEAPVTSSLMTRLRDNALAYDGAPTGTRRLFQQTAAPLGWTKETNASFHDRGIRLTTGTVSSGGSVAFSTAFARQATDGHALDANQNGPHVHAPGTLSVSMTYTRTDPSGVVVNEGGQPPATKAWEVSQVPALATFNSMSGNTASNGNGTPHSHNIDLRLAYIDWIIGQKAD